MFGLTILYAVVYVAIAIGISASVTSKAHAAASGFGIHTGRFVRQSNREQVNSPTGLTFKL
ncbi:hypothetical protein [Natrialba asiatica]|uniref:Copper ABC transporter permease n=1 Tax=Natrialba asiatica (strain ATCC 700177 / DSM 12278 / JCM 9576 / FERM P-10747 / NBRC 102637 / 172P1) TaxID=29540 RepID=M0AKR3_NATA1|nr:hypothetical protein [Natrialba asiatica]ELY99320.1 copper ABC transporter permease [Natrialba asiatica DSM 12278]